MCVAYTLRGFHGLYEISNLNVNRPSEGIIHEDVMGTKGIYNLFLVAGNGRHRPVWNRPGGVGV